jgi:hypothetical protein
LGRARVTALISVDLPALGKPTNPTSATSVIERSSFRRSVPPGGVTLLESVPVRLKTSPLPSPPAPPLARSSRSPGLMSSFINASVSASVTRQFGGTLTSTSGAARPLSRECASVPGSARTDMRPRKCPSVLKELSHTRNTLPPAPPFPPAGLLLLNPTAPLPPAPLRTNSSARSKKRRSSSSSGKAASSGRLRADTRTNVARSPSVAAPATNSRQADMARARKLSK